MRRYLFALMLVSGFMVALFIYNAPRQPVVVVSCPKPSFVPPPSLVASGSATAADNNDDNDGEEEEVEVEEEEEEEAYAAVAVASGEAALKQKPSSDSKGRTRAAALRGEEEEEKEPVWADMLYESAPCPEGISVLWVIRHFWGSQLWSGYEIAEAIHGTHPANGTGKKYSDIVCVPIPAPDFTAMTQEEVFALLRKNGHPQRKRTLDLCVFVKDADDHLITRCREMGASTAVLWVDNHPNLLQHPDYGKSAMAKSPFDFHINPNTLSAQHYAGSLRGNHWFIPQHDSNLLGFRKQDPTEPVRIVGWQGSSRNRMAPETRDAVEKWAEANGVTFKELYYEGKPASVPELKQERDDHFKNLLQVDIMILFPSHANTFHKLVYKPNARNIVPLSLGIPTIIFPYVTYMEELRWSHYPGFASSLPELIRWLDILISNAHARVRLSQLGLKFVEHLSLDNVARKWVFHIRSGLCGRNHSLDSRHMFYPTNSSTPWWELAAAEQRPTQGSSISKPIKRVYVAPGAAKRATTGVAASDRARPRIQQFRAKQRPVL